MLLDLFLIVVLKLGVIGTALGTVLAQALSALLCGWVLLRDVSLPFFPVLGVLLCLRTAMRSMGYKTAPVVSSCVELAMKAVGAVLLIPTYGYLGTSITEPVTWVIMTIFLVSVYTMKHKKIYVAQYQ